MKKLITLSIVLFSLSAFGQKKLTEKPKEKDSLITLQVTGFSKSDLDALSKQTKFYDSLFRRELVKFLETKGIAITPETQVLSYDKGNLSLKIKK